MKVKGGRWHVGVRRERGVKEERKRKRVREKVGKGGNRIKGKAKGVEMKEIKDKEKGK